jgi:hypothetical protein
MVVAREPAGELRARARRCADHEDPDHAASRTRSR